MHAEKLVMAEDAPGVSVIIPAYNARATLDRTLHSVRRQSWTKLEIIVVDDGSRDDTSDIIAAHTAQDPRVRGIRIDNSGVAVARNTGIAAAQYELVAPVDADDLWHPRKVELQMKAWQDGGCVAGLVYSWHVVIDEDDQIVYYSDRSTEAGNVLRRMCMGNLIGNGSTPMMLKSAVMATGGYDAGLRAQKAQGCEDLKIYFEIAERYSYALAPYYLVGYRATSASMSSDGRQMLRSFDLVMGPAQERHPQYADEFRSGRIHLTHWLLERAVIYGSFKQMVAMFREHCRPAALMIPRSVAHCLRHYTRRLAGLKQFGAFDALPGLPDRSL